MITENGFGIMGFFSKGCWVIRSYCFVIWKILLTQLIEKKTFEVGLVVGNGPIFQFTCIKTT